MNEINDAVTDKNKRPPKDPLLISDFESVQETAKKLIASYHPELATANIIYLCRNNAQKSGGVKTAGTVKKASPIERHLGGHYFNGDGEEADFIIMIAMDVWNEMRESQRVALVDHLLTRCVGTEDEESGDMKYSTQTPRLQEFPDIAERHGLWNDQLTEFMESVRR